MTPPWCRAAVVVTPSGVTGRFSTKEDHRVLTETTHQLLPVAAQTHCAAPAASASGVAAMTKTIAARFSDEVWATIDLVSDLESKSVNELINEAMAAFLAQKIASGDLEARAAAAMAEIDAETKARKQALDSLVKSASGTKKGRATKPEPPAKAQGPRRGGRASPEAPTGDDGQPTSQARPIGFAPPSRDSR